MDAGQLLESAFKPGCGSMVDSFPHPEQCLRFVAVGVFCAAGKLTAVLTHSPPEIRGNTGIQRIAFAAEYINIVCHRKALLLRKMYPVIITHGRKRCQSEDKPYRRRRYCEKCCFFAKLQTVF